MLALAEILHPDPTLIHQHLKAEIDTAQADNQLLGKGALTDIRGFAQASQHLKLDVFLK